MRFLIILLLLSLYPVVIFSQNVENVRFEQQGNRIIIYYDLISKSNKDNFTVNIYYTTDYGNSFTSPRTLAGDVGSNITAGRKKKVVWNVLNDIDELKGEIKFKVTAITEDNYTFLDYDLFLNYRIAKYHLPYGGRLGILGPERVGGYLFFIYNYTTGTDYDSGIPGSAYHDTEEYIIVSGGAIINLMNNNKYRFSTFAGGGFCNSDYSNPETDWAFVNELYLYIESGVIFNLNHINISLGIEKIDELYVFAGIGFTL